MRQEITQEIDQAIEEVEQRVQQIDFQTKPYLTELQRTNLQQAITVRKQIEAEKQKHTDLKDALTERKAQVAALQDGEEIVRGTLESYAEVKQGDNLAEVLAGVEIVVKDDVVVAIAECADGAHPSTHCKRPVLCLPIIADLQAVEVANNEQLEPWMC